MPPWLGRISKYAGMAIALCQAIRGKGPLAGKLACFAMNFAINYAAGELVNGALKGSTRQISGRAGHPVHMPTGAKILDGDAELDFALEAPIPLVWQRFYSSLDARTDGLFGRGWSVPYMVELLLGQAGAYRVVWIDSQGRRTPVPDLQPGQRYHNRSEGLTFACTHGGHWMVEQDDGLCFDFGLPEPGSGSQILRPQVIEDRNANWLYLRYDVYGRLSELATMSGHLLTLEYDGRHARRVVRVLLHAAHATDCLAQYTYTEAGLLASVSDGEGHELRRFGYDEAGRMTMHRLPGGLTSFYRWEEFARTELAEENELQDREARVTENWTDEGEHYRFTYDFHSQATEVTDHLGRRQRCEWNGDYLVTAHTDALGHTWRFGWSKYREQVSVIEPDGAVTRMRYDDERGLPVRVTDALDRVMEMTWHPKWAELEQKTLPNGIRWTYEYDSRGNVVCEIDPLGQRTESRLGRYGYPQVLVDARGGITQFGWDARHRLSARTDCSGRTTRFAHDVRGRLTAVTDALGHTTRYCYDGRDRLLAVEQPDGGTERYQWTAGGAMEEVIDGNGHATRLAYDRAGRVTSRIDANGHRVTLEYDAAGNLRTLFNEKRDSYRFEYDAGDRLIEQTAPDGVRVEYQHNAAGLPLVVHQAVGTQEQITVVLRRDGLGRLVRKTTPETATAYHYDLAGQVERIERTDLHGVAMDSVALGYDALGRVVEETTVRMKDGGPLTSTLTHEYDALGNRLGTTLPGGHTLRWLYYGSGQPNSFQVEMDDLSCWLGSMMSEGPRPGGPLS
jgi:YD repeat-containing protein